MSKQFNPDNATREEFKRELYRLQYILEYSKNKAFELMRELMQIDTIASACNFQRSKGNIDLMLDRFNSLPPLLEGIMKNEKNQKLINTIKENN